MPQLPQTERGTNGRSKLSGDPIRKEKPSFATQSLESGQITDRLGGPLSGAVRSGQIVARRSDSRDALSHRRHTFHSIKANQAGRRDQHSFCRGLRILQAPASRKSKFRTELPDPKDELWLRAHMA